MRRAYILITVALAVVAITVVYFIYAGIRGNLYLLRGSYVQNSSCSFLWPAFTCSNFSIDTTGNVSFTFSQNTSYVMSNILVGCSLTPYRLNSSAANTTYHKVPVFYFKRIYSNLSSENSVLINEVPCYWYLNGSAVTVLPHEQRVTGFLVVDYSLMNGSQDVGGEFTANVADK